MKYIIIALPACVTADGIAPGSDHLLPVFWAGMGSQPNYTNNPFEARLFSVEELTAISPKLGIDNIAIPLSELIRATDLCVLIDNEKINDLVTGHDGGFYMEELHPITIIPNKKVNGSK